MALLINAQTFVGSGSPLQTRGGQRAYLLVESSGNSASAGLLVSPNGIDHWMTATAFTLGAGVTATAQVVDLIYPFVMGNVNWVSAGTRTAMVTMYYVNQGEA